MKSGTGHDQQPAEKTLASENEKLALECEKLRAEIRELESPKGWSDKLSRHSTLVSMLLAIFGFIFGFVQYGAQQEANRKTEEAQAEQERRIRDREFMKPLWEKQLTTYFEASQAAATIATSTDPKEGEAARNNFWMLYQGPLVIVESPSVSAAMKAFGQVLATGTNQSPGTTNKDLATLSRELASAFQESLIEGANLRLDEFRKGKFDYRK
jgi:hypothetical protein